MSVVPRRPGPDTRRYARELGVDLHNVSGSGEGGRITRDDVQRSVREMMSRGEGAAPAQATRPASPRPAPSPNIEGTADTDALRSGASLAHAADSSGDRPQHGAKFLHDSARHQL